MNTPIARYEEQLSGTCPLGMMNGSLEDYAMRIRLAIAGELAKPDRDNALISLLCDAARVGWELLKYQDERLRATIQNEIESGKEASEENSVQDR